MKEDFSVISFYNRSANKSTQSEPGYTLVDMAEDANALLEDLEILQAYIFGISMGWMIALNLVAHHSEKVKKLAPGCTTPGGVTAVWSDGKCLRQ